MYEEDLYKERDARIYGTGDKLMYMDGEGKRKTIKNRLALKRYVDNPLKKKFQYKKNKDIKGTQNLVDTKLINKIYNAFEKDGTKLTSRIRDIYTKDRQQI